MNKIIELLSKTNEPRFNLVKLAEELAELSEIVLKMNNKSKDHQPPINKLVEEIGDVKLRINVLIKQYHIKEEVKQRVNIKCAELKAYYDDKLYIGGL